MLLLYSTVVCVQFTVEPWVHALLPDLLKDEKSEQDLVGPTLPALKAILDISVLPTAQGKERFSRTTHGLISSCLLSIDGLRYAELLGTCSYTDTPPSGREGVVLTRKIKNNLLAIVLILTVVPNTAKVSQAVVERACFLITDKLLESRDVRSSGELYRVFGITLLLSYHSRLLTALELSWLPAQQAVLYYENALDFCFPD